jgi:hypothetical protein
VPPIRSQPTRIARTHPTIERLESLLSDRFGRHVILTSSGRAGIVLTLTALGLSRYKSVVAIPRVVSSCVVEAVSKRAFPVAIGSATRCDLTVHYHQYGLPQQAQPPGAVIEDLCHSLLGAWRHPTSIASIAVFSFPKFFATNGMCGGLLIENPSLAVHLRELLSRAPELPEHMRNHLAKIFRASVTGCDAANPAEIESAYAALTHAAAPRNADLIGCPEIKIDWETAIEHRQRVVDRLLRLVPDDFRPNGWSKVIRENLPFAFPIFSDDEATLARLVSSLVIAGVDAGIYSIDVNRNWAAPLLRRAVLVPCHGDVDSRADDVLRKFPDTLGCGA